jgi:hypothetical protein
MYLLVATPDGAVQDNPSQQVYARSLALYGCGDSANQGTRVGYTGVGIRRWAAATLIARCGERMGSKVITARTTWALSVACCSSIFRRGRLASSRRYSGVVLLDENVR